MKTYDYLIVAEKNEQAKQLIAALGFTRKGTHAVGVIDGKKAVMCWSKGHLFTYVAPNEIDPSLDWKTLSKMTPIPRHPARVIMKDDGNGISAPAKDYFDRIAQFAKESEEFIICTDPDEEGEKIGWEIYQNLGLPNMPVKRAWLSNGLGTNAVKRAFQQLYDAKKFKSNAACSDARSGSDWSYQYLTRALTAVGKGGAITPEFTKGTGSQSVASSGRVQTATLGMIVSRDAEVESFVKKSHFTINGSFDCLGGLVEAKYAPVLKKEYMDEFHKGVEWTKNKKNSESNKDAIDTAIYTDAGEINLFKSRLMAVADQSKVVSFDKKETLTYPPMTFDTTDALKAISKVVNGSATQIQETLNKLYLAGYITYPRTDHKEVPSEDFLDKNRNALLDALSKIPQVGKQAKEAQDIHNGAHAEYKPFKPKCYADKQVEHTGIIPTPDAPDLTQLTSEERSAYLVIAKRFIQALYPPRKNYVTSVTFSVPAKGMFDEAFSLFKVKSSFVMDHGFEKAFGAPASANPLAKSAPKEDMSSVKIPDMTIGTLTLLKNVSTKPQELPKPKYYNRVDIIDDMKTASKFAKDKQTQTLLAGCGIGTPATRPSMIDKLLTRNYIVIINKDTKDEYIKSTKKGRDFIKFVPDWLSSIELTAFWEKKLKELVKEPNEATYLGMMEAFIEEQVSTVEKYIRDLDQRYSSGLVFTAPRDSLSPKKIERAKEISQRVDVPLTAKELADGNLLSDFIERYIGTQDNRKVIPTLKMTEILLSMLKARGLTKKDVPQDAFLDFTESNNAIEALKLIPLPVVAPSARQIALAEYVVGAMGLVPPADFKENVKSCVAFLKGAGTIPPSQKQKDSAIEINKNTGIPLPEGWDTDFYVCGNYVRTNAPEIPPTEKQISAAENLSAKLTKKMPDNCKTSMKACSEFIGECMKELDKKKKTPAGKPSSTSGQGKPTAKQLSYATKLAAKKKITLPNVAKETFDGCRAFIDRHSDKKQTA